MCENCEVQQFQLQEGSQLKVRLEEPDQVQVFYIAKREKKIIHKFKSDMKLINHSEVNLCKLN